MLVALYARGWNVSLGSHGGHVHGPKTEEFLPRSHDVWTCKTLRNPFKQLDLCFPEFRPAYKSSITSQIGSSCRDALCSQPEVPMGGDLSTLAQPKETHRSCSWAPNRDDLCHLFWSSPEVKSCETKKFGEEKWKLIKFNTKFPEALVLPNWGMFLATWHHVLHVVFHTPTLHTSLWLLRKGSLRRCLRPLNTTIRSLGEGMYDQIVRYDQCHFRSWLVRMS